MKTNKEWKASMLEEDIVEVIFAKYRGQMHAEREALLEAVRMGRKIEAELNGRR